MAVDLCPTSTESGPRSQRWRRLARGLFSAAGGFAFPLGRWFGPNADELRRPERLEEGLTIVLPGVEGRSSLNADIARGLLDAGTRTAIEVVDWTTGLLPLFLLHLRSQERNRLQARAIAGRIVDYQDRYPGRPVHLVGHSAGGGMALLALSALPEGRTVTGTVLLAAAVSRRFEVKPLLERTERGIWNFHSPLDGLFLGTGTLLCGTVDGRHCVSAGAWGFRAEVGTGPPEPGTESGNATSPVPATPGSPKLYQRAFQLGMVRQFNFGGHFGCTNRVFIAETVAPLLAAADETR